VTRTAIEKIHDEAVDQALDFMERHAGRSRQGHAGEHTVTAGFIASVYRHGTSREQDPQLHSHAFIHNVCTRPDGTTGTIESRDLYVWQRAGGAAYRVALADGLGKLGYEIELTGEFFRVKSVSREAERCFSRRRAQIEAELKRQGTSGARASEMATLNTRKAKKDRSAETLREEWKIRAKSLAKELETQATLSAEGIEEVRAKNEQEFALNPQKVRSAMTEKNSTFSKSQAYVESLKSMQGQGELAVAEIATERFLACDPGVVKLRAAGAYAKGGERYTTPEMIALETGLADRAERMSQRLTHSIGNEVKELAYKKHPTLSDEQRRFIEHITSASDVALAQGSAGSGKTYALGTAREAWEAAGYRVHGVALSGAAADQLEHGSGIESTTISKFLGEQFVENEAGQMEKVQGTSPNAREAEADRLDRYTVVVLDEAGMVGSRQMDEISRRVDEAGAKLVAVGDTSQLQAIDAGAAFRAMAERVEAVEMIENRRQVKPVDRLVVSQLRAGDSDAALNNLDQAGRVHVAGSARAAKTQMGRVIANDLAGGRNTIGIVATQQDASDINRAARANAIENGTVAAKHGARVLTHSGEREFAPGDRIVFDRNVNGGEHAEQMGGVIKNGYFGTVIEIMQQYDENGKPNVATIRVKLDAGGERLVDTRAYDYFRYGYAVTAHKAQGVTVDRAHVLGTETSMPTGLEWSYVAGSRHRSELHIYTDKASIETLAPNWSKSRQKDISLDYQVLTDRTMPMHGHDITR
jgi:thymidine kinase